MSKCPPLAELSACLLDLTQSISKRTHAAFYLRTFYPKEAVGIISESLLIKQDSSLMRHELAYVLGQIRDSSACSLLSSLLDDENDDILVRHESAEALGAIGEQSSLEILQKYATYPAPEISETCIIAIDLINWRLKGEQGGSSHYLSVDPAPSLTDEKSIPKLKDLLMDTSKSLFDRYRAMFTLRDLNSNESSLALLIGFKDESSLFRHEVAYVLGQMQRKVTIEGLSEVLRNETEHRMVRHEAAEALGAIGGVEVEDILNKYKNDEEIVVKESCDVALDTMEYWSSEF